MPTGERRCTCFVHSKSWRRQRMVQRGAAASARKGSLPATWAARCSACLFCGWCTNAGLMPPHAQVLLLDELTTFLDYEDQENVLQCVRAIVDSSRQPGGEQQAAAAAALAQQGQQRQRGGGLDPSLVLQQEGEWQQQQQRGVTALWVTHRLEELEYADSVR